MRHSKCDLFLKLIITVCNRAPILGSVTVQRTSPDPDLPGDLHGGEGLVVGQGQRKRHCLGQTKQPPYLPHGRTKSEDAGAGSYWLKGMQLEDKVVPALGKIFWRREHE